MHDTVCDSGVGEVNVQCTSSRRVKSLSLFSPTHNLSEGGIIIRYSVLCFNSWLNTDVNRV